MNRFIPCPCGSKLLYPKCCERYHKGALPENAQLLMRSRYCAYAVRNADYVVSTTHPSNPNYEKNVEEWKEGVLRFCDLTAFNGLDIDEFVDGEQTATVTFTAHLMQGDRDATFTERSTFEKLDGRWLYRSGDILKEAS